MSAQQAGASGQGGEQQPTPENILSGLQVQEKSQRELRRYLFQQLWRLQVRMRLAPHLLF
jgi:hypothetical protein